MRALILTLAVTLITWTTVANSKAPASVAAPVMLNGALKVNGKVIRSAICSPTPAISRMLP